MFWSRVEVLLAIGSAARADSTACCSRDPVPLDGFIVGIFPFWYVTPDDRLSAR
jgi:microcompartment protein CcmK/EutM